MGDSTKHSDDPPASSPTPEAADQPKSKRMNRQLIIPDEYTQGWDTRDAFRELYQNWRDAIVETFNLDDSQFCPAYTENDHEITVTAPLPTSRTFSLQMYGFIRFSKKRDGKVTIVNADAKLQPDDLQLGQTTKGLGKDLIGCHGKGLKLATKVMMLAGYKVHIESMGQNFNFALKGSNLHCTAASSKRSTASSASQDTQHLTSYSSRVGKDVAVCIDGTDKTELERGRFLRWLRVSLEIRGLTRPSNIIETEHGDLVLEQNYADKIYFKGLLLPRSTPNTGALAFGYNLHQSRDIRDRKKLANSEEEAQLLCRTWEAAIQQRPDIALPRYINLLRNSPQYPDVTNAAEFLDFSTSKMIWNQLRSEAGEEQFYYCGEISSTDAEVITGSLKKQPASISRILWNLLRRHFLVRTAEEERIHRFRNAKEVRPPETTFSKTIQRFIKASLLLKESTSGITVSFADSQKSDLDLCFNTELTEVRISDKWLDFYAAHAGCECKVVAMGTADLNNTFLCDHIAESVFISMISQLMAGSFAAAWTLKAQMDWFNSSLTEFKEKVRRMPREIDVKQSPTAGEMIVTWEDGEARFFSKLYGKRVQYHVCLHEDSCWGVASLLLHPRVMVNDVLLTCGCRHMLVSQEAKKAVFDDLDPAKRYFPMVAENEPNSFYGIPPNPIYPPDRNRTDYLPVESIDNGGVEEPETPGFENEGNEGMTWGSCVPSYTCGYEIDTRPLAALESRRLECRFEMDEYIMVTIKCAHDPSEVSQYLLCVHGNFPARLDIPDDEGGLLVTQYSFLRTSPIFRFDHVMERYTAADDKEMLLHFQDFESMGERNDAAVMWIKDIVDVRPVEINLLGPFERMQYTVDVPSDLSQSGLFCRFAVRCGGPGDSACLTPVGSHLLPRSKRWAKPRYKYESQPVVLDFNTGVTDDGPLQGVLSDFKYFLLNPDSPGAMDVPTIGTLTIPDKGITPRREQIRYHLTGLRNLQGVVYKSSKKLDFLVLALPSWILRDEAYIHLFACLYDLLQTRYCIHLKNVVLAENGASESKTGVILLASSVYSQSHWKEIFDKTVYSASVPPTSPPVGQKMAKLIKEMIQEFCSLPEGYGCMDGETRALKRRREG